MASFYAKDRVLYLCSCGNKTEVYRLYFCRHCMKLRCSDCVSHEVDSHYCPNCLESMPTAEARLKKNRCANCFDCPSCKHTLSTRATSNSLPSPEDPSKVITKKVYYLACGFCRWTSRDVDIPDQLVASGGWKELENVNNPRINNLVEYYRVLAQKEKMEKDRRKFSRRRSYHHFSADKYGLSSAIARKRAGLSSLGSLSLKDEETKPVEMIPSEASEEVEPLPEIIFTETINLATICDIAQRISLPEFQPAKGELFPHYKRLLIRRSQRCKECEHNLSKPEFNPASIKFKIQLVAFYHVPEIKVMKISPLHLEKASQIFLTLMNPAENVTYISLLPADDDEFKSLSNAKILLPEKELIMAARDDAAEYDDSDSQMDFKDDPKVVVFRKANKIGIQMEVIPQKSEGNIWVSFVLKYNYINMTTQLQNEPREPQTVWLQHHIDINLGKMSA